MAIWEDVPTRKLSEVAVRSDWSQAELAHRLMRHFHGDAAAAGEFAWRLTAHLPDPPSSGEELFGLLCTVPELTDALPVRPKPSLEVALSSGWRWPVARWHTVQQMARELDVEVGELLWFADLGGWLRHADGPLRHYRYRWVRTRSGGVRLIEQPKARLAELQRRITRHVLAALPVHDAAHGFRRGRSALTFAKPHAGQELLVRADIEGFFASLTVSRLRRLMRAAGYPDAVAAVIVGLLTTATPADVLSSVPAVPAAEASVRRRLTRRLAAPHVPQGAPSSPALANAVVRRLDRRLTAYSDTVGTHYTRYADDLAFSGDRDVPVPALLRGVGAIVRAEEFRLRPHKTRVLGAHQRQKLAGLVVNQGPVASRAEYDALRALLHNCTRTGPEEQNRDGHADFRAYLLGRIGWVGTNHPQRARTLRELFDRIDW